VVRGRAGTNVRFDYWDEPHRHPVRDWLFSKGFIYSDETRLTIGISWSSRSGYDFCDLEFYPLARHAQDTGCDVIIGHHASGRNPRTGIGTCENLADVQMVYNTIRLINGHHGPEPDRGPNA
jgi:hypothetical protein